ncbi:MAG TPA: PRC-barrel domain-containing protein [Arenibaculum sp.]|nr:PRC-barrel domain-containing protein [Arenibaculum sp.]
MRLPILLTTATVAVLVLPQASPAQQNQGAEQTVQQGAAAQTGQVAEQCLQDLQRLNDELVEGGYGLAGPQGYGVGRWGATPGAAIGTAPAAGAGIATAPGTETAVGGPVYAGAMTPRAEMRVLMQAGYILAMNGDQQGCEVILSAVEENRTRYEAALQGEGDWAAERQTWRERHLAASIPVDQLQAPLRVDQIVGTDVRNMQDEDLGDVEDIVMGPQGGVQYVLVGRGGFLGVGENYVPVRWADLRITPSPYQDTLILDVSESAFEQAPSLDDADQEQLASVDWQDQVDQYWSESLEGDVQQQGTTGVSGEVQQETGASQ